jgi:archaellum component FlaC
MSFKKPRIALSMSKEEESMQNRKIDAMKDGMEKIHNDLVIVSRKLDRIVIVSRKLDKIHKYLCEMED